MCMPSPPKPPKPPPAPPNPLDPSVLGARDRQRRALINSQGFRSTILTGPLGLTPGAQSLGGPTLLGGGMRRA